MDMDQEGENMLLKSADDKSKRLALLVELQSSANLDADQKRWLRDESIRLQRGIQGEKDAAHYLDSHFKDGRNHVVMHDLRFVVDGQVAQIDHLVLNRMGHMYLIETKNFSGNVDVNEHGEFSVQYGRERFGIPSPLEQSRRHEPVLAKLLEQLGLSGRIDRRPDFHHVVMFHPKAIIKRPEAKRFDTSFLIKADQFPTWHAKFADQVGAGTVLRGLFNMRSLDTMIEWGEKLIRQHRPADLLALPAFMQPKVVSAAQPTPVPQLREPSPLATNWGRAGEQDGGPAQPAKRRICAHCGASISYAEGQFCWNNPARFGGQQYCRAHQALFAPARRST